MVTPTATTKQLRRSSLLHRELCFQFCDVSLDPLLRRAPTCARGLPQGCAVPVRPTKFSESSIRRQFESLDALASRWPARGSVFDDQARRRIGPRRTRLASSPRCVYPAMFLGSHDPRPWIPEPSRGRSRGRSHGRLSACRNVCWCKPQAAVRTLNKSGVVRAEVPQRSAAAGQPLVLNRAGDASAARDLATVLDPHLGGFAA